VEWEDRQESSNVEDRRGMSGPMIGGIAGGGGAVLLLIIGLLFGVDLSKFTGPPGRQQSRSNKQADPREEKLAKFARVILKDTEDVWGEEFSKEYNRKYKPTTMVLFSGQVKSGCGVADSNVGPFYCPADQKVYLDLGFFDELEKKLGAKGEFARAYVIAHEVGHHVQNLLGYNARVDHRNNQDSVRLELQADYLAGVWAHHLRKMHPDRPNLLTSEDVQSGIGAAMRIGDDYLQKKATGQVRPEKFTHGTSKSRAHWLGDGLKTGDFSKEKLDGFFTLPYKQVDVGLQR
jgi:predicted metalloprotease